MWGSRKGESPAFTGSPFPPRLEALKDRHQVLHLLILWSLLSLPPRRPPPPTGLGLPQQAPPPSTSYLPSRSALRPPASFPAFWHSTAQSSILLPTPQAAPGPGVGRPSPAEGGALGGHHGDEEEGRGGCVRQPGMSDFWECTEPRNPGPSQTSPPHTGFHLPEGQAVRGRRCSG